MANEDLLKLDSQLCFRLYAASRALIRSYQPILSELELTYPQYLVMLVLWEKDDLTVKQIGERLALDSGTLTPLLKRLEQSGYVIRQRRAENEREVRILLTSSGRSIKEQAKDVPYQIMTTLDLPAHDLIQLKELLDKLLKNQCSAPFSNDCSPE
ncbi:MarR family transcriptional regulator [Leeia sp. TBRC 13508]|uniref:MarR family transcriptional regulator n=1 Tax=Leeia speluncae TaxID=2884804 RepID=A0ABS8D2U1_9NEIS|nr:MarR family transcriptional regulator [Leeia speluncae]MCB6182500.1 MarR family transcriptional regulator [Leeia speluncae]